MLQKAFSPILSLNGETQRNKYYNKRSTTHDNDNIQSDDTNMKVNQTTLILRTKVLYTYRLQNNLKVI